MYATIRYRARGEHTDDDLAREGRALGARLATAPGFIACLLLATPDGCAAIGIFEDAASLAAAEPLVAGWDSDPPGEAKPCDDPLAWLTGEVVAQRGL